MRFSAGLSPILFGLLVGNGHTVFPSENHWKIIMQSCSGTVRMDDILLGVLKGGEVVVDFVGEIYQKIRGGDEDESEDEKSDSTE